MWQHAQPPPAPFPASATPPTATSEANGLPNSLVSASAPFIDLWRQLLMLQQHAATVAARSAGTFPQEIQTDCVAMSSTPQLPPPGSMGFNSGHNFSCNAVFEQLRSTFRLPSTSFPAAASANHFAHALGPAFFPPGLPPSLLAMQAQSSWANHLPFPTLASTPALTASMIAPPTSASCITSTRRLNNEHTENNSGGENEKHSVGLAPKVDTTASTLGREISASKQSEDTTSAVEQSVPSWMHPSTRNAPAISYNNRLLTDGLTRNFPAPASIATAVTSLERQSHAVSSPLPSPSSMPYFALRRHAQRLNKPRRARTAFTNEQTDALEDEYKRNEYISKNRRHQLASQLNLTEVRIKIWYQNRRAKDKRIEKAKSDRQTRLLTGTTTSAEAAAATALASFSSANPCSVEITGKHPQSSSMANAFLEYFRYHHRIPAPEIGATPSVTSTVPSELQTGVYSARLQSTGIDDILGQSPNGEISATAGVGDAHGSLENSTTKNV